MCLKSHLGVGIVVGDLIFMPQGPERKLESETSADIMRPGTGSGSGSGTGTGSGSGLGLGLGLVLPVLGGSVRLFVGAQLCCFLLLRHHRRRREAPHQLEPVHLDRLGGLDRLYMSSPVSPGSGAYRPGGGAATGWRRWGRASSTSLWSL